MTSVINPRFHAVLIDHYKDLIEKAKDPEQIIILKKNLAYHEMMYKATQN